MKISLLVFFGLLLSFNSFAQMNIETRYMTRYSAKVEMLDESDAKVLEIDEESLNKVFIDSGFKVITIDSEIKQFNGEYQLSNNTTYSDQGSIVFQSIIVIEGVNYLFGVSGCGDAWWVTTLNSRGKDYIWKFY